MSKFNLSVKRLQGVNWKMITFVFLMSGGVIAILTTLLLSAINYDGDTKTYTSTVFDCPVEDKQVFANFVETCSLGEDNSVYSCQNVAYNIYCQEMTKTQISVYHEGEWILHSPTYEPKPL